MRLLRIPIFIAILVAVSTASAQKRNITEKDLFEFAWIGDAQVSPDGSTVAFVKVTVSARKDGTLAYYALRSRLVAELLRVARELLGHRLIESQSMLRALRREKHR